MGNLLRIGVALVAGWVLLAAGGDIYLQAAGASAAPPPQSLRLDVASRLADCLLGPMDARPVALRGCRFAPESRALAQAAQPIEFATLPDLPKVDPGPDAPVFPTAMILGLVSLAAIGAGAIWTLRMPLVPETD